MWRKKVRRSVLAHRPRVRRGHPHPSGSAPLAYCICGEAIVEVAGVWWHIIRTQVEGHP